MRPWKNQAKRRVDKMKAKSDEKEERKKDVRIKKR